MFNEIHQTFNKIYLSLIKEIKKINTTKDNEIIVLLKTNYKVFDKKSIEYLEFFNDNINDEITKVIFSENAIIDNLEVLNMEIFKNISIQDILQKIIANNDESRAVFEYYIYILMLITYIYNIELDYDKKYILLQKTLYILNNIDKDISTEAMESQLEDILDDDIKTVLWKMYNNRRSMKESIINIDNKEDSLNFIANSKIGSLAKDISESINIDELNIKNPEDLLNMENMFSGGSNNVFGNLIQKVGTAITDKIQSGELSQEELMTEAISMMGTLKNSEHGNMMSQMMGMMGGMHGNMNMNQGNMNPTKQRLQKKLMEKNRKP
jgi:hypothetical protein